jgi:hypothetical protein
MAKEHRERSILPVAEVRWGLEDHPVVLAGSIGVGTDCVKPASSVSGVGASHWSAICVLM